MKFFPTLIGKIVIKLLHVLGRTGSALPGLIVERLSPQYLPRMLGQLSQGVIVISGTNGKTTTTKLVTSMLEAQGLRVLTNKTGSNFVRGTISTIAEHATYSGKLPYDIAVFEQDEAHAVRFVAQVKPRGVVVLNIMRDQMDRFGEIDITRDLLQKVVDTAAEFVVLNANDERVNTMRVPKAVRTIWYGHSSALRDQFLTDDQLYGDSPAKGTTKLPLTVTLLDYKEGKVSVDSGGTNSTYEYLLNGSHNAINLAAALAVVKTIVPKLNDAALALSIAKLEPAFGRGETFRLANGVEITLQLVKNPGGFMHALRMLDDKKYTLVGIAINDEYADGRDVSWLWDVDFTKLAQSYEVITAGTRGADMALRLKYDDVTIAQYCDELAAFVQETSRLGAETNGKVMMYCTYTAMLALRELYKSMSTEVYEVHV